MDREQMECREKNVVKIRIVPVGNPNNELNTKSSFWNFVSNQIEKENEYSEKLENIFKKQFAYKLNRNLQLKFENEFEDWYYLKFRYGKYRHKTIRFRRITKFFLRNKKYRHLLNKIRLATQINFNIGTTITYSSLGFDLFFEPFDKVVQLFDNNFDIFRITLDQYIRKSFDDTFCEYSTRPISVSITDPQNLRSEFENPVNNKNVSNSQINANYNDFDRANWLWILANTSLVVPVIVALVIFNNKYEDLEKFRQENHKEINKERDNLLKNYQELIDFQKKSYHDLIEEIKRDTIK